VKRAYPIVALALLAGGDFVKAPTGWKQDVPEATALTEKTNKLPHFGGAAPTLASAQIFTAPDGPGGLYVIGVAAKLSEHRDAAVRVAVDSFLGAPERARLTNADAMISINASSSRLDDKAKQVEATLQWKDNDLGVITNARLLVAADAENLIAVTGECVLSPQTTPASADACFKALATLDTGIAIGKRVVLGLSAAGTEPPPGPARPSTMSAPTMSDGSRTPMPPITLAPPAPKRTVDRRPVYVGAGLVVLAGLFWWNRRRRERLESGAVKKDTDE
jgi:hypothetical protein